MAHPIVVLLAVLVALFAITSVIAAPAESLEARAGCWSCCKRCQCKCQSGMFQGKLERGANSHGGLMNIYCTESYCDKQCTTWQTAKMVFVGCDLVGDFDKYSKFG